MLVHQGWMVQRGIMVLKVLRVLPATADHVVHSERRATPEHKVQLGILDLLEKKAPRDRKEILENVVVEARQGQRGTPVLLALPGPRDLLVQTAWRV